MIRENLAVSVCAYLCFNGSYQLLIHLDGDQCSNHSLVLKNSHNEMVIKFSLTLADRFYPSGMLPQVCFILYSS